MNFAPRVMVHERDLAATGLVQPASRITWRHALVGESQAVARYTAWAQEESQKAEVRGVRVETLEAGRPEMRQTLERASKFLHLVALLKELVMSIEDEQQREHAARTSERKFRARAL